MGKCCLLLAMNQGKYAFSQLISFVPRYEFDKCVKRFSGDFKSQTSDLLDTVYDDGFWTDNSAGVST